MKGISCVRRVRLGLFQYVIGSSSVFHNEWLFMGACFYSFVNYLVVVCNAMVVSRLFGVMAACCVRIFFAQLDIVNRNGMATSRLR